MQKYILKNGTRVILSPQKETKAVTVLILFGVGSRYETDDIAGISHFLEHMMFKGTTRRPNTLALSKELDQVGAQFNAFTSKDHTGYWIKSTNEHFETAIDVISDMIQNPLLSPEEIEREKGVIAEEINLYEDTPMKKVGELFEGLLYQGNPLGFDIAGKKETVQLFNQLTFTEYIKNLYHPENAVLVVAGGLNQIKNEKLKMKNYNSKLKIIENKFKTWDNAERSRFIPIKESQTKPQMLIKYKKTEQAHFCLGFRAFSFNNPRKYTLHVLSAILGGGMSSRLFIQVRERRGLCYYISTGTELYSDCGNIVTQAGVVKEVDKIKEAIEAILNEHKKIIKGEITRDELKRAKELIKGRLMLSLEDSATVATFFGTKKLLQDKIETAEEVIKKIEAVTAEEITQLAKKIFIPKNLNLALIGPFGNPNVFNNVFSI